MAEKPESPEKSSLPSESESAHTVNGKVVTVAKENAAHTQPKEKAPVQSQVEMGAYSKVHKAMEAVSGENSTQSMQQEQVPDHQSTCKRDALQQLPNTSSAVHQRNKEPSDPPSEGPSRKRARTEAITANSTVGKSKTVICRERLTPPFGENP